MAYCSKCGNEKEYPNGKCPECGYQPPLQSRSPQAIDDGGFLWSLLGFCVPIVGLILYLVWKEERPNTALAAGKGALAYVIVGGIFFIIYIIFFVALLGFAM